MRELLFRAKRNFGRCEWVFGVGVDGEYLHFRGGGGTSVDPATVGQYTGYDDVSGTKIYEGDIISAPDGKESRFGTVRFDEYADLSDREAWHMGFFVAWHDEMDKCGMRRELGFWAKERLIKIIGNAYEPERTEETKQ
jgi:hypothetical protein